MAVTKTVRYHHFELVSRIMEIMGPRGKEKKKEDKATDFFCGNER